MPERLKEQIPSKSIRYGISISAGVVLLLGLGAFVLMKYAWPQKNGTANSGKGGLTEQQILDSITAPSGSKVVGMSKEVEASVSAPKQDAGSAAKVPSKSVLDSVSAPAR